MVDCLCGGKDENCQDCDGCGRVALTRCPKLDITPDTWEAIEAAEWASKGAWYMPGGWGDQTVSCVEFVRFALAEKSRWEARMMKDGRKDN